MIAQLHVAAPTPFVTNIIDIAKFLHYVYNHIISGYIVQNIYSAIRVIPDNKISRICH